MSLAQVCFKLIAMYLAVMLLILSCPPPLALAGLVSTDEVLAEPGARAHRVRLVDFLQREDVRGNMVRLGIPPQEAIERVAVLSDAEVLRVAGYLDTMPAGQSVVGALIGAALVIFLVLLVTDLLGLTDVFPFVKKKAR